MPQYYQDPSGDVLVIKDDGTRDILPRTNFSREFLSNLRPSGGQERESAPIPDDYGGPGAFRAGTTGFGNFFGEQDSERAAPATPQRSFVPRGRVAAPAGRAPPPPPPPAAPIPPQENEDPLFGGSEWWDPWTSTAIREGEGALPYIGRQFMEDIGRPIGALGTGLWQGLFGRPPAPAPAAPRVEQPQAPETFPVLPEPTFDEAMEAEGFNPEPPTPRQLTDEDLPPIPALDPNDLSIDPALEARAQLAREREGRLGELTAGRRSTIEGELEKARRIPRWLRATEIIGAGLSGWGQGGIGVERATRAYQRIPEQIAQLENQLMQLGLSQEEVMEARENAELAPLTARNQIDTQVALSNHQSAVQEAQQMRSLAIQANQEGNAQNFAVYSQRLQIALQRLKQSMENVHRSINVQAAMGGTPTGEAILQQVSPSGPEAQAGVADRLYRANLQGLIEREIALGGTSAGDQVSVVRRRVNEMFARMGMRAPKVDRKTISNPAAFAEYLIRESNGRILQDREVRNFEYIPGIASE